MMGPEKVVRPVFGDDTSPLFDEVSTLSEHELHLTIGSVKRPKLPWRQVHPVIQLFSRDADPARFEALKEDIRQNGQRKAIAMYQGFVWDGVSRYNACVQLGLVPKLWILRAADPIIYLLRRHESDRYGAPNSPERDHALKLLDQLRGTEWIDRVKKQRSDWMEYAREDFRELQKVARPCAACGLGSEYSHAHHVLPLSVQYDLGVDAPIQDYEWLCHVHHKHVHQLFASRLRPTSRNEGAEYRAKYAPDNERPALIAAGKVFERGWQLFSDAGGISERGNWAMVRP